MHPARQPKSIVLYADDDRDDLDLMAHIFSSYPHLDLLTFSSGQDLLSYVSQIADQHQVPCVIILDINMPVMNGWETLDQLKKLPVTKDCLFLFFSTSTFQLRTLSDAEKDVSIVAKPSNLAEIDLIMEKIISYCPAALQAKLRNTGA